MTFKVKQNIMDVFSEAKENKRYLKVCAPMVRYSKINFRTLVKNYGVDLCYTPMIMADSFCQNEKARLNEFMTTANDFPVIVQFAANNSNDFLDAAQLVYPYADGVDLNCGCPQRWAIKDGYGCALMSNPQKIYDLVKAVRNTLPSVFSVSVKIRILKELKKTISLCQQLEQCGVNFITVHGRTPAQKSSEDISVDALKQVVESVRIPVIANGGVRTLEDSDKLYEQTSCGGVMAASGLLTNPALFSGVPVTPLSCIKLWMDMKNKSSNSLTFQCYHHHLVFMLEKILTKQQKQVFNYLDTFESVDTFLCKNILNSIDCVQEFKYDLNNFVTCEFSNEITMKHSSKCRGCKKSLFYCICSKYDCNASDGNFFKSYVNDVDVLDYIGTMFDDPI